MVKLIWHTILGVGMVWFLLKFASQQIKRVLEDFTWYRRWKRICICGHKATDHDSLSCLFQDCDCLEFDYGDRPNYYRER
jgi:hypothetical protein